MRRVKFSISLVAVIALLAVVVGVVAGRATSAGAKSGGGGKGGPTAGKRIDVIVKASDSSFWQTMLAGARQGGNDYGLTVSLFGPTSETDVNQQVQLVENSISRGVDGIVLAPNSSSALNNVIDRARKAKIKVIVADTQVTTATDGFIGTDNTKAAQQAGQRLCKLSQDAGNTSGDVTARAIKDNRATDRIPVVSFDTDPQQVAALGDGSLDALIVQNPYFFGYQGVVEAAMATVGSAPPPNLDPGAVVADKSNMNDAAVKQLLTPPTAKAGK